MLQKIYKKKIEICSNNKKYKNKSFLINYNMKNPQCNNSYLKRKKK